MVKVEMPRAQWNTVIYMLEECSKSGYMVNSLIKEIEDQVYSQEY